MKLFLVCHTDADGECWDQHAFANDHEHALKLWMNHHRWKASVYDYVPGIGGDFTIAVHEVPTSQEFTGIVEWETSRRRFFAFTDR